MPDHRSPGRPRPSSWQGQPSRFRGAGCQENRNGDNSARGHVRACEEIDATSSRSNATRPPRPKSPCRPRRPCRALDGGGVSGTWRSRSTAHAPAWPPPSVGDFVDGAGPGAFLHRAPMTVSSGVRSRAACHLLRGSRAQWQRPSRQRVPCDRSGAHRLPARRAGHTERGRLFLFLACSRHSVLEPRYPNGAVLHLLLDVWVPAHR